MRLSEKKRNSAGESIVSGAFSLAFVALAVKILGVIYKIPLSHILGDEGMGYFNTAYTVYACLYLICTAGVPKAVSILTTEALVCGRDRDKKRIFRVCMGTFGAVGGALAVLFILFGEPIATAVGNHAAAWTMIAIAPSLLFVSLGGVIRGYLNGHARLFPIAVSQLTEGICKLVFGLLFANYATAQGYALPVVSAFTIFGITVGSVFAFLLLLIFAKNQNSHEKEKQKNEISEMGRRDILRRILHVAIPVTTSAAVMSMTNMLDLGLIMRRLSDMGLTENAATALYGNYTTLAVPMFNLAAGIVASVALAVLPRLTGKYVLGDTEGFRELFRFATEGTMLLMVPFSGGLFLFGREVLILLFRDDSAAVAAPLLAALTPAMLFMSLLTVVNTVLEASGHPHAPLISMSVGCVAKLFVSYILIGRESFGILGAPVGTVISYAVSLLISLCLLSRKKQLRISFMSCFWRPLLACALSLSTVRLLYRILLPSVNGNVLTVFCVTVGGTLYLLSAAALGAFSPFLHGKFGISHKKTVENLED